jgi:hypothetical protein
MLTSVNLREGVTFTTGGGSLHLLTLVERRFLELQEISSEEMQEERRGIEDAGARVDEETNTRLFLVRDPLLE